MKTALTVLFFSLFAFIASCAEINIVVTLDNGTTQTAKIAGPAASAGIDSAGQWIATQKKPDGSPKYKDFADLIKQSVIDVAANFIEQFPSSATKAAEDDLKARKALLEATRKALLDAARQ